MEEKRLIDPLTEVIPVDGGGPSIEPWWQKTWQRVTNWFYGTATGGIYESRVDLSHYDRWQPLWRMFNPGGSIYNGVMGLFNRAKNVLTDATEDGWWSNVKDVVSDAWGTTTRVLHDTWVWIWDNLPQWLKDAVLLVDDWYDDISKFFTDFYTTVKDFLGRIWAWLWEHFVQWFKDAVLLVDTWYDSISNFFTNLYTTIKDFLSRIWAWLWEHFAQWVKDVINLVNTFKTAITNFFTNLYNTIVDFLGRVWAWIYEHIPQEFKDIWNNAKTWWDWLKGRWDSFTREVGAFINDPYGYLTGKLQAWIEGWRDYILGVVGDLLDQLQREIILHLLDWMGYVAPPIEAIDEMGPHFSSFTDMFKEWANAWKERKEAWVKEAMVMMEAFAAELRGEEEMDLLTPSETILQYWQMLTPEQIRLIVEPPIKG